MVAYTITLFVLCLASIALHKSLLELSTAIKVLIILAIILLHLLSTASLLAKRLSRAHNEYLQYLGFRRSDLRSLVRIVATPSNFAHALIILALLTGTVSAPLVVALSVAVFTTSEFLAPALLWAGQHSNSRNTNKRGSIKDADNLAKAFSSPCRSFLTKDISAIKTSDVIGMVAVILIGFFVMLFSNAFDSLQAYTLCLYIGMLLPTYELSVIALSKETESYHRLYLPLMHMTDRDFLTYKLPLQLVSVTGAALALSLFSFCLYDFSFQRAIISVGMILYFSLFAYSINWIHLKRIRERRAFDSLYELSLMPLVIVPFLATAVATALHAYNARPRRGNRKC